MVIKRFKIQNNWYAPKLSQVSKQTKLHACLWQPQHIYIRHTTTDVNITGQAIYILKRKIEPHSCNQCSCGKAVGTTDSECVFVALVIQHTQSNSHTILPSVVCLAIPYFSTLSHKQQDFQENITEHKMCVLIFSIIFVWNISHSKKNSVR